MGDANPVCSGGRENGSNGSGRSITITDLRAIRDDLGLDVEICMDGGGWLIGLERYNTGEDAVAAIRAMAV